jgi:hypothetical protein
VSGLTNAYRWEDPPGAYERALAASKRAAAVKSGTGDQDVPFFVPQDVNPVGAGRKFTRKTLKLNFWRPGDEYYEHEKEFRLGIPGEVDYEWVYR